MANFFGQYQHISLISDEGVCLSQVKRLICMLLSPDLSRNIIKANLFINHVLKIFVVAVV